MAYFLLCLVAIAVSAVTGSPVDDGRIVNGMEINIRLAPYVVRITDDISYCGGSLVGRLYVLTAAHCVAGKDISKLTITANVTSIFETGIRRKVVRYAIHPEYNSKDMHSDVAVLQLNEPIANIPTIPLCKQPLRENDIIQVSGWGRSAENMPGTVNLNTVFLPVRSKESCDREYYHYVKQNMFCASGLENKAACRGDSGGPAVHKGQVCGIVAFSYHCGVVGSSEVYTDVYAVKEFVENFMWLNWE